MKIYSRLWLVLMVLAFTVLVTRAPPTSQSAPVAGPWYVAPDGDDGDDCLSTTTPCATINGAIGKAGSGDTIYVAVGTYTGGGDEVVLISKSVTLSGGWDGTFAAQNSVSTIDGGDSRRGITADSSVNALVERFVVQNGIDGNGGGISNGGTLTVNNTIINDNMSFNGGGGIINNGTLTLNNSTISDNTTSDGGAGGILNSGTLIMYNSIVSGNTGTSGSGIINWGSLTLNNSTISDNTAIEWGGGIRNSDTLTVNNSTISGNTSFNGGGGIINEGDGTVVLNIGTVSGNVAGEGGGIYNWSGSVTLNNSTVSANKADAGGGIYHDSDYGAMTLRNSILADNTAGTSPDCGGSFTIDTSGYNLIGDTSGCNFAPGTGDLTNLSAKLGRLIGAAGAPKYHPLLTGSPAIDAGNPAGCTDNLGNPLNTDQRGAARVGRCDIGAYEYTAPGPAATIAPIDGTPQSTPPYSAFEKPLRAAVLDSIGSPVSNATVTFSAPASGASGTFADSSTFATTALTNEGAVATASTFYANGLDGSYTVTATVTGIVTPASFLLSNRLGWYVDKGGDDSSDCQAPTTPCATINGALGKAGFAPGDTVLVAAGTYTGTAGEVLALGVSARLLGGWNSSFTIQSGTSTLDGQSARRGIDVDEGMTAIVERFTIQNGSAEGGGGIYNYRGSLTLRNVTVTSNTDGGIGNYEGILTLKNSTVSKNIGGGIGNDGILALNNSTVSGNTSTGDGAGISNAGTSILKNSTVSGNVVEQDMGGPSRGGGIHNSEYGGSVVLQNSILAGNTAAGIPSDCSGSALGSLGHNLIGNTSSCTFISAAGDLINVEPKLGSLEGSPGYHPLLHGSPAIDAGNPSGCTDDLDYPLATDQRGRPRLGPCDIGAYEAQALETSSKTVDRTLAMPGSSLNYAIALRNIGDASIEDVIMTDTIPGWLTYHDGSLDSTGGTCDEADGTISCLASLNAGASVTVTYEATLEDAAPVGMSVVNSAVISAAGEIITRTATLRVGEVRVCNLTKYQFNQVLQAGDDGGWDSDDVWAPTVLKEGVHYKMWYSGDDGSGPSQIGLATSTDGVNWTKALNNPVLSPGAAWEAAGLAAASVVLDGAVYMMWYTGFDSNGVGRIGCATSPDGVAWTKCGGNPVLVPGVAGGWEDAGVMEPTVIKEGGTYHMWYVGSDSITPRIGHATSSDGVNWIKDSVNPVLDIGPLGDWDWLYVYGPEVVAYSGSYLLWYSGGTLPTAWQTGYATSDGASNWLKQGVVVPAGDPEGFGSFDVDGADFPTVIADGSTFKVWYTAMAGEDSSIGFAAAEVCGLGTRIERPVSNAIYLPVVVKDWSTQPCPFYYADDFGDHGSGWPITEDETHAFAYTDGEYQISIRQPNQGWFVTPGALATDFSLEVSARRTDGTYGAYGVIFGLNEDWGELYEFDVDDRFYSIWKLDHGAWTNLRDWTASNYIKTGTSWNRLRVVREGAEIAVYVNDQHLATVSDGSFVGLRRIGLYAGSFRAFDARFDDLALYPADYPVSCGRGAAGLEAAQGSVSVAQYQPSASSGTRPMPRYLGWTSDGYSTDVKEAGDHLWLRDR